jgi:hypothetical protein
VCSEQAKPSVVVVRDARCHVSSLCGGIEVAYLGRLETQADSMVTRVPLLLNCANGKKEDPQVGGFERSGMMIFVKC